MIRPAGGADLDVVAASVVAAIDQHMVHAGFTQFAEGDLLRAGHIPAAAWTVGWLCVGTQHQ
jgi:hypothetical protein